ncbi:hypothetical protein Goari_014995, partial [Gossypium aridum]|nr:hypothetical protein [Gossypium aridum]
MAGRWATSAFRWVFSDLISVRPWPMRWGHVEWPQLSRFSFSIVDDVVWSLITAFEIVDCRNVCRNMTSAEGFLCRIPSVAEVSRLFVSLVDDHVTLSSEVHV